MALTPSSRIGVYEVIAPLGAGGMGEVYRARDTKLSREIALKILPEAFSADPDRLVRFTREAQTLAALNHPNIAAIYGLEESGGVRALVMELVEGEDLAQRIQGQRAEGTGLPVDEALAIAKQLAEALEAAHEQGIIHRDLKPANIKVREDGTVKVLDFGLAKALDSGPGGPGVAGRPGGSMSPTLTTPAVMTGVGVILGTAAYMAPEQAKGRAADKRSDVWAFGCVLYEMLTGKRAFDGEDMTDTIAAVVRGEPDWTALPKELPASIVTLIKRCLEKDRKQRIGDIAAARFVLSDPTTSAPSPAPAAPVPVVAKPSVGQRALPWTVATASLVLAAGVLALWAPWRVVVAPAPVRFTVAPAGTFSIPIATSFRDLAISPDGTRVVYTTAESPNNSELWVRATEQLDAVQLTGLSNPFSPFVSPDSKWIAFVSGTELKKISMTGGPPISLCQIAGSGNTFRGGAWLESGMIVFATTDPVTGLLSVPAGGGEPKVLTKPDTAQGEVDHLFPSPLPGGRAVLLTIRTGRSTDASNVGVLDLKTGERKVLIRGGSNAEYVESGHLIYAAAGALRAVRFDPVRLEVLSDPVPVVERVTLKPSGAAEFSVSRQGTLLYLPGTSVAAAQGPTRSLVWVDRKGQEEEIKAPPRTYQHVAVSPDGTRIALDIRDQENDIWIWDIGHETLTRLTTDPQQDAYPVWTADSRRVIFMSSRAGQENVYWQLADGSAPAERLTTGSNRESPMSVTPDGSAIVVRSSVPNADLMLLHLDGKRTMDPLVQTPFEEHNGVISPDGHWFAYDADDSKNFEVYVRPFPNVNGGRWQVSTRGGRAPVWSPDGRELFYQDAGGLVTSVAVRPPSNGVFNFGPPTRALEKRYLAVTPTRSYDISHDGKKFLMIKGSQDTAPTGNTPPTRTSMTVVLNWFEELKQRVPSR